MPSQGPNSGSTFTSVPNGMTVAWSSPGNASASDGVYATATLSSSTSDYLQATGFGFAIPVGATIDGIVVEWQRASGTGTAFDAASRVVKGGTIGATDRSSATPWPSTESYETYGSSADLWGETWTAADINSANFGAAIAGSASFDTGQIDHVRITVYYTPGPTDPPGSVTIARRPDVPTDPVFSE